MNKTELLQDLMEFISDSGYYSEFLIWMEEHNNQSQEETEESWERIESEL